VIVGERIQVLVKSMPDIEEQLIITHKYTFGELTPEQQTMVDKLINSDIKKTLDEDEYQKLRDSVVSHLYRSQLSGVINSFYSDLVNHREELQGLATGIPLGTKFDELTTEQQETAKKLLPSLGDGWDEAAQAKLRDTFMSVITGERIQAIVKSMPDIEKQINITHNRDFDELDPAQKTAIDWLIRSDIRKHIDEDELGRLRKSGISYLCQSKISDTVQQFYSDLVTHREEIKMLSNEMPLDMKYAESDIYWQSMIDRMLPVQTFGLDEKGIDKLRDTTMRVIAGERIQTMIKSMPGLELRVNITHKCEFDELTQKQKDVVEHTVAALPKYGALLHSRPNAYGGNRRTAAAGQESTKSKQEQTERTQTGRKEKVARTQASGCKK